LVTSIFYNIVNLNSSINTRSIVRSASPVTSTKLFKYLDYVVKRPGMNWLQWWMGNLNANLLVH